MAACDSDSSLESKLSNPWWKLSSSDLHSRLKTRKVLGVGETDDGDVHRSKLSQILGHSDQLYVRLPWGLRMWQFIVAVNFTIISLWALLFPSHLFDVTFETEEGRYVTLPVRLYGSALLGLAIFHWNSLHAIDRDVIRTSLLSSVVYFMLQTIGNCKDFTFYQFVFLMLLTTSKNTLKLHFKLRCFEACQPYTPHYWWISVAALSSVSMRELLPLGAMLCHMIRLGSAGLSGVFYWILLRDGRHYTFR